MHQSPIPFDSLPKQSIHERLGLKNQDKSQRFTPVKERLGKNHFDSPPRQSIREIYDTNSQEETQRRTPLKKRLGDKHASSEQETSQRQTPVKERLGKRHTSSGREDTRRENPEPRRKSKRTRDQSSYRLRSSKKPKKDHPEVGDPWQRDEDGEFWFPKQTRENRRRENETNSE